MLVSWNWLKEYVDLDMDRAEAEDRLAMSGLNHEGTEQVGDDWCVDLEVTSNRPDCLGHLGVAREIAVLWEKPLRIPEPKPEEDAESVESAIGVEIECDELCNRYTARVIRGVKVGPSPDWLKQRLAAIGVESINNVVDVTNFVMMECGQPLHAFDLDEIKDKIIVRRGLDGEEFEAINHRGYTLDANTCVIADKHGAVALGGVMGGVDTEVSTSTTDVLVEAAEFAPKSIRDTVRKLVLPSPSSYRFERGVDPRGVDWASRRCCELILQVAGGRLLSGVVDRGAANDARRSITLRFEQIDRVLGIDVEPGEVERILVALGAELVERDERSIVVGPPSWRRDLTREIDLIEEVARIHGYEKIPEDVGVPMAASHRTDEDRVLGRVRHTLTATGFDEALTTSMVPRKWDAAFSPWEGDEPLTSHTAMLKGAATLRRSLVPSLLNARRINQSLSNPVIELFETARLYLPSGGELPVEQRTVSLASGRGFGAVKGVVEAILSSLAISEPLEVRDVELNLLTSEQSCELLLGGERLGFLGVVAESAASDFNLRGETTVAELSLELLSKLAQLVPQHVDQSPYPSIARDLNLIVAEQTRWAELSATVRAAAGPLLEQLTFQEIYRDADRDGADRKRVLFSFTLRSPDRTMTNEEADVVRDQVEAACRDQHEAVLVR